jgi:hypothetical protein
LGAADYALAMKAVFRYHIVDLFNNPVGCLTSLADLADFLQKSAKSAIFQRKLFNN